MDKHKKRPAQEPAEEVLTGEHSAEADLPPAEPDNQSPPAAAEEADPVTEETQKTVETAKVEPTSEPNDKTQEPDQGESAGDQATKEEDMTESTARTIEVDEEEMLFTRRKLKNLQDDNKKLNNELETLKDRLLRLTAEYENYRNRTAKEKDEISAEATVAILRDILPVIDNLERALVTETDDLPGLKEGVQMTLDQFVAAMQRMGVELIPTEDGFDPAFHEAVMHETDASKGPRTVAEVFLKGYKKGDKVVRHSVVKVAN